MSDTYRVLITLTVDVVGYVTAPDGTPRPRVEGFVGDLIDSDRFFVEPRERSIKLIAPDRTIFDNVTLEDWKIQRTISLVESHLIVARMTEED